MQALDEMVAELFRDGSPISTSAEPQPTTSISQPTNDEAVSEAAQSNLRATEEIWQV